MKPCAIQCCTSQLGPARSRSWIRSCQEKPRKAVRLPCPYPRSMRSKLLTVGHVLPPWVIICDQFLNLAAQHWLGWLPGDSSSKPSTPVQKCLSRTRQEAVEPKFRSFKIRILEHLEDLLPAQDESTLGVGQAPIVGDGGPVRSSCGSIQFMCDRKVEMTLQNTFKYHQSLYMQT